MKYKMNNMQNNVITTAVDVLAGGGTLLYPTDTIWGVGCDACNAAAVESVYAIKRRDHTKSMLVLCSSVEMAERYVGGVSGEARALLLGEGRPTTVIMPVASGLLARNLVAADGTIGVRIPRMDFCRALVEAFGRPVVSTSANLSGRPSPSCFGDIDDELKGIVDYCVPGEYGVGGGSRSSRIVKVTSGGIEVIRD